MVRFQFPIVSLTIDFVTVDLLLICVPRMPLWALASPKELSKWCRWQDRQKAVAVRRRDRRLERRKR